MCSCVFLVMLQPVCNPDQEEWVIGEWVINYSGEFNQDIEYPKNVYLNVNLDEKSGQVYIEIWATI